MATATPPAGPDRATPLRAISQRLGWVRVDAVPDTGGGVPPAWRSGIAAGGIVPSTSR